MQTVKYHFSNQNQIWTSVSEGHGGALEQRHVVWYIGLASLHVVGLTSEMMWQNEEEFHWTRQRLVIERLSRGARTTPAFSGF